MQNNQIEIVTREEKHFVGVHVTNVFQRFDPESMKDANQVFLARRSDIKGILN